VPLLYTPIQQSYRLPGPTFRLGEPAAGNRRIELDDERDEFLREKQLSGGLWRSTDDRLRLGTRVQTWLRSAVLRDQPSLAPANGSLDDLVANIQEDVVFMARDAGSVAASARAVYVNVSFPSGWCPQCVCGKRFLSIHAPVPNADQFNGHGRKNAADLLFQDDDLVRFVWSLTPDDRLDRRLCRRISDNRPLHESFETSWAGLRRLFLRVERQVISPIDQDIACFFIRIYRFAVADLPADVRERIRSSIVTMPPEVLRYKGIAEAAPQILALL